MDLILLKKIIKFFILLFTAFSCVFTVFESLGNFKIVNLETVFSQMLFLFCVFILFAFLFYYDKLELNKIRNIDFFSILLVLKRIEKKSREIENTQNNKFMLKIEKWRLDKEEQKVNQINAGTWTIDTLPVQNYQRYIFGSIMSILDENDSYLTVTTLKFWIEDKLQGEKDFLLKNKNFCERKGNLSRIFLIDEKDLFDKVKLDEIRQLLNELVKLKTIFIDKWWFIICIDFEKRVAYPVPFAIVHDDKKKSILSIIPSLNFDDILPPKIEVKFYNSIREDKIETYYLKFKEYFNSKEKIGIDEMFELISKY